MEACSLVRMSLYCLFAYILILIYLSESPRLVELPTLDPRVCYQRHSLTLILVVPITVICFFALAVANVSARATGIAVAIALEVEEVVVPGPSVSVALSNVCPVIVGVRVLDAVPVPVVVLVVALPVVPRSAAGFLHVVVRARFFPGGAGLGGLPELAMVVVPAERRRPHLLAEGAVGHDRLARLGNLLPEIDTVKLIRLARLGKGGLRTDQG